MLSQYYRIKLHTKNVFDQGILHQQKYHYFMGDSLATREFNLIYDPNCAFLTDIIFCCHGHVVNFYLIYLIWYRHTLSYHSYMYWRNIPSLSPHMSVGSCMCASVHPCICSTLFLELLCKNLYYPLNGLTQKLRNVIGT